jgi:hypothetical protein
MIKRIIILISVIAALNSCATIKKGVLNCWNYAVGTIMVPAYTVGTSVNDFRPSRNGDTQVAFEYYVNDKRYLVDHSKWRYLVTGEKFKIEYDSLDPSTAEVLIREPLFLPSEERVKTIGTKTDLSTHQCCFEYDAMGIHYKKVQFFNKDLIENYPELKIGSKCEVEYDPYIPQRAIIYLDRPIKDEN